MEPIEVFFAHADVADPPKELRSSRTRHYLRCHQEGRVCFCGDAPLVDACAVDSVIATHPKTVNTEEACSICFEDFEPPETNYSELQCKHIFHSDCIKGWLYDNPHCPNCRKGVTTEFDKCLICEATGLGNKDGIEGTFQCCGFRTHVTCWSTIYDPLAVKRCPGCQHKDPQFEKFYNFDLAKVVMNDTALSKLCSTGKKAPE